MPLLRIFANNILPVLLISGGGFTVGKVFKLDSRPLGKVIFYIFSPLLVFKLLTTTRLPLDQIVVMMAFTAANVLTIGGLAFLAGRILRLERSVLIVVILTAMCTNAGNYGLPLVSFAFGQQALAYASIFFVTGQLLFYSVGVVVASLGHLDIKAATLGVLKVPAIYAIILALLTIRSGSTLPEWVQRAITLAADGAIPGMLVLLGLELANVRWNSNLRILGVPIFIRLVVGPLIGLGMGALFGLQGSAYQAGVAESATPTAVMTTILAAEYNLNSSLLTAVIFAATILSPLTLTPLLYFLGR
jgi:predicted permease